MKKPEFRDKCGPGGQKILPEIVREIRRLHAEGQLTNKDIGVMFGVDRSMVSHIVRRLAYREVE